MTSLSAVIITCNEEEKIQRALESVQPVCDEIVVVDSGSQDRTLEICSRFTGRILQKAWMGYRDQKQWATEQAQNEWVLSIDADEALSPELVSELQEWKRRPPGQFGGYFIPRKTFFMNRWIEHTSWYPDWQMRLFHKGKGRWEGGRVHESFRVDGPTIRLKGHLLHFTYSSLSEYLTQLDRFSSLAAKDALDRGSKARFSRILFQPPIVFLKNYVLKRGLLDGKAGLTVSCLAAVSILFKQLKLLELQLNKRGVIRTR